jgi:two-component system CheB/CheR fusion protein
VAPYRSGHNRIEGVVVTFIDVTTLSQAEGRQILLIAELQHRTRNLLGLIQSIAHRTMSDCGTLNEFSDRLSALARAQSLLGGHLRENVELADLVALELRATGAPQARIVTEGPAVVLGFEMVQTICLALHELATNAVKHGALHADAEHGRLEVRWSLDEQGVDAPCMLKLQWRESGVRIPAPPQRKGFGRELIEKSLAYTLDASTQLEFTPEGAVCNIEMAVPRRPSGPALDVPNHPHPH